MENRFFKRKVRVWIVGVEDIRPYDPHGTVATVCWHTERTRELRLRPHRTSRYGKDELDLYMRFVSDLESVSYVLTEEPYETGETEA
jgi:hypothetical protein